MLKIIIAFPFLVTWTVLLTFEKSKRNQLLVALLYLVTTFFILDYLFPDKSFIYFVTILLFTYLLGLLKVFNSKKLEGKKYRTIIAIRYGLLLYYKIFFLIYILLVSMGIILTYLDRI